MSSSALRPGQIVAGRYRIEQLLGEGGMGSVYRAVELPEERLVALKLLVDEQLSSPAMLERFEREARALERLVHPNTVRLLGSGSTERGLPFIVMELLEGSDLAEDLARHGPMRWDHALALCREVLGALAEAHEAGIIHRDIKPANIFLCAGPSWPTVKVLDFGIAGATEVAARTRRLTLTGTVIGSASYMSPEQAQGKAVGPATDLYALGAVLFEMLTGKPPFDGLVFTAQLLAKVMQPAPGVRAVRPDLDVPPALDALVADLLERDPMRRPPSARQLGESIGEWLGNVSLPALARPVSIAPPPLEASLVPKTAAMLPPTIDAGWSPRKTEAGAPQRMRTRPRGLLRWALAAPVPLAALVVWWVLRPLPVEPEQPMLALMPALPLTSAERAGENAGRLAPSEPDASDTLVARATPEEPAAGSNPPDPATRKTGSERRAFGAEPVAPPGDSTTRSPATRPVPPVAAPARPATVIAAVRAERAGEITPLERNDIIAALRRQRYAARARAASDYRAGRIGRDELKERQRAIDRRFEGK